MILSSQKIISNSDSRIKSFYTKDYTVYYAGFIFISGKKQGEESIRYLIDDFLQSNQLPFSKIYGNYFVYIEFSDSDKQLIFTDHSGMFKIYRYKDFISTSFLELVDTFQELDSEDLDFEAITEFLFFGSCYLNKTYLKPIQTLDEFSYYTYENNQLKTYSKEVEPITTPSKINLDVFFKDLIYAISDNKVSLDLTGGNDSRLIMSYFYKNNASFELAIGGKEGHPDVEIADKLAKRINRDFYPFIHHIKKFKLDEFYEIFEKVDGLSGLPDYHRNHFLQKQRLKRKVEIQLSGQGGELYKDSWWIQDFPFYNKKSVNFERFYNLRVYSTTLNKKLFGKNTLPFAKTMKSKLLKEFQKYRLNSNTRSYDNAQYNVLMKTYAGKAMSIRNNYLCSYAPLMELELLRKGFNLKRRKRFFSNFHRELITKNSPEIAKIKTTTGVSLSSKPLDKLIDVNSYISDFLGKGKRIILQKLFKRKDSPSEATDSNLFDLLKSHNIFKEVLSNLKEKHILNPDVEIDSLSNSQLDRIFTLGLFLHRLENKKTAVNRQEKKLRKK